MRAGPPPVQGPARTRQAAPGGDISKVADPEPVRRRRTEVPVHLVHRARRACIGNGGAHFLAANTTRQTHLPHQTLDGGEQANAIGSSAPANGDRDALAVHPPPDFGRAIDPDVVLPDAFDHRLEGGVALHTRRRRLWLADAPGMVVIARRGNRRSPPGLNRRRLRRLTLQMARTPY